MARELITDDSGKVTAVSYIDKPTGKEQQVRCRTVVLVGGGVRVGAAAAQLEVAAASARPRQRDGHGRQVPHRHGRLRHVGAGAGPARHAASSTRTATARISTSRGGCSTGTRSSTSRAATTSRSAAAASACPASASAPAAYNRAEGYGLPMKQAIRERYGGTTVSLSGRGSMVPNEDCYCEIDPDAEGQVGHSGAALPLEVERLRAEPGAATCARASRRSSRRSAAR